MKRIVITAVIGFSMGFTAAASLAQEVAESIEVRVVNVDVVVRDRAGKPVTGLTKADFEIYENGRKREITNLSEVRAPVPAASAATVTPAPAAPAETPVEVRPRNIVLFVDNYSIEPFRRDKVLQSLDKFVDQLGPQDLVMIVLSTQKTTVVTPFTSDRKAIRAGIETIKMSGSTYNRTASLDHLKQTVNEYISEAKEGKLEWRDAYAHATSDVASHVEEEIFSARDTLSALGQVTASPVDQTEHFMTFTNTAIAYQTLARISGGLAITNTSNFDSALQTVANDLNSYYSLGFKPADSATEGLRRIVVKMKNPEYRFRARETYIANAKPAQDEMSTRVIANLYTTDARNAWEISVKPGAPQKEGSEYRVPFEVTMAPTITLAPDGDNLVGNFAVFVVVGNGENTSKVVRNAHAVKVPVDAEDDFREKKITYKATITMNPGDNILSVAVVDQASKMAGFARAKVALP